MSDNQPGHPGEKPGEWIASAVKRETVPQPVHRRRSRIFQAVLLVGIGGFVILAYLASTAAYTDFDLIVTRLVQTYDFIGLELLMRAVSWMGYLPQAAFIGVGMALVLWWARLRREARLTVISAAGVEALNLLIKLVVHRPRPSAGLVRVVQEVSGYSFPSGHVMFYLGLFGFLAFLSYALLRSSWKRTVLLVVFTGLVTLVGLSRVFLGEHWISDVVGGYLAGGLWLAAMIEIYRRGKEGASRT